MFVSAIRLSQETVARRRGGGLQKTSNRNIAHVAQSIPRLRYTAENAGFLAGDCLAAVPESVRYRTHKSPVKDVG